MSRAALTRRTAIAAAGLTSVGVGGASLTPVPTQSPGYRGDVKFTS